MEVAAQPGIGIKPLLSLQRHYRVSLVVGLLVFVLGLPVVWIKGQSIYTTEAVFQVSPRYMKNLKTDAEVELQSNQQYREYVNHLSKTVLRYDVLSHALSLLRERGINPKPPAWSERKYIEKLQTLIYVKPILDTYMVKVGIEGGVDDKAHLHELINTLMMSFLETSKDEQIYGSSERLNVLQDTASKLKAEVSAMEGERVKLGERLGLTTFNDGAQNPYDNLLSKSRERLAEAENERAKAEAMFKAFIEHREIPADQGRSMLEIRLQDLGLQTLRTEVTKRVEELTQLIAPLEAKHPAREPAEAEIKTLLQRLKAREEDFDRQTYDNYRQRFQASLNQKIQVEHELRQSLQQLEGQSAEYGRMFQDAIRLTKGIREREERLQQIRERLNYLETERHALGFVRLVTPALPAEMPMGVGKTKLLLGLLVASFALGLSVPVLIDMLDRRIRSVNEAEKLMGIPAAGWQIRREDLPTQLFSDDQTRRFVSALIRIRGRHQRQVFAFTSVKSGGGTTTTILDTARALQTLGAKVLVLEINSFAPYAPFDPLQPGLTDYLAGKAPLAGITHPFTFRDQTFPVVSIGGDRASGIKRLDLLMQAIRHWQEHFDYLLVDLPPILLAADTEMLIESLGQVFLLVEAEAVVKGEVGRAKRLLQKIDPEGVGLFVNAVPLFRGSGYMEEVIIETITRGKLSRFMSLGPWHLQWELLKTRWALYRNQRSQRKKKPAKPALPASTEKVSPGHAEALEPMLPPELPPELPPPESTPPSPSTAATEPAAASDAPIDAPIDVLALNNQGVLAARNGDLETAVRLLCQAADHAPGAQYQINAAHALLTLWARQGWQPEVTRKARIYLQRAGKLAPEHPGLGAARTQYTALLNQQRAAQSAARATATADSR